MNDGKLADNRSRYWLERLEREDPAEATLGVLAQIDRVPVSVKLAEFYAWQRRQRGGQVGSRKDQQHRARFVAAYIKWKRGEQ